MPDIGGSFEFQVFLEDWASVVLVDLIFNSKNKNKLSPFSRATLPSKSPSTSATPVSEGMARGPGKKKASGSATGAVRAIAIIPAINTIH